VVHNLTFHGVGPEPGPLPPGEARVWISRERFGAVLDSVQGRGDVRISFDDSNRSDVDVALPALRDRGLRATFFVLAGRLGDPRHLGADDLAELVDAGMTIGSHGMHHRDWRRLGDAELEEELVAARRILHEASGTPVTQASVPFGSYDRRVLSRLRARGYATVFTSDGGPARPDAWLQPRTSVTVDDEPARIAAGGSTPTGALKRLVKRWR
jgi:peptidoglycan/xylan/chitin deacetylase (PgdA/CDA1 family)